MVSGFLSFLVSWFLGLYVSKFIGFLVSWLSASWILVPEYQEFWKFNNISCCWKTIDPALPKLHLIFSKDIDSISPSFHFMFVRDIVPMFKIAKNRFRVLWTILTPYSRFPRNVKTIFHELSVPLPSFPKCSRFWIPKILSFIYIIPISPIKIG